MRLERPLTGVLGGHWAVPHETLLEGDQQAWLRSQGAQTKSLQDRVGLRTCIFAIIFNKPLPVSQALLCVLK